MVLSGIRKECIKIVNGGKVDHDLFYHIIDFVRNYADKYHHQKEENRLFNVMSEELAPLMGSGPITGMLVEHDFGRAHIYDLEQALKASQNGNNDAKVDIIASAMGYQQMLLKHIDKEDNAIYKFAERSLSKDTLNKLDKEFVYIENEPESIQTRNKYISFAKSLS
jgi:hemerythrin-like domain-containing protein